MAFLLFGALILISAATSTKEDIAAARLRQKPYEKYAIAVIIFFGGLLIAALVMPPVP